MTENIIEQQQELEKMKKLLPMMITAVLLGLASMAMVYYKIPGKFWLALLGYFFGARVVIKKDGALFGILQVILVIPAIILSISDCVSIGSASGDTAIHNTGDEGSSPKDKNTPYGRLSMLALVVPALALLASIIVPVIRFVLGLFS